MLGFLPFLMSDDVVLSEMKKFDLNIINIISCSILEKTAFAIVKQEDVKIVLLVLFL